MFRLNLVIVHVWIHLSLESINDILKLILMLLFNLDLTSFCEYFAYINKYEFIESSFHRPFFVVVVVVVAKKQPSTCLNNSFDLMKIRFLFYIETMNALLFLIACISMVEILNSATSYFEKKNYYELTNQIKSFSFNVKNSKINKLLIIFRSSYSLNMTILWISIC